MGAGAAHTALPPGAEKCYAPEVGFGPSGRLYYLFVGLAGRGNTPVGAYLTWSDDRGRTFAAPRQVLGPASFGVRMAIEAGRGPAGRIHLVWVRAGGPPALGGFGPGPNPVVAAYSDDGGQTFSAPVVLSGPERARVVAPALTLGPGGGVHAAYYDLGQDVRDYQGLAGPVWPGPWALVVRSSADSGESFGPEVVVDSAIAAPERVMLIFTMAPAAMAATGTGRLCLAWTDARSGDADALLRCADRGRPFEAARRLNDDAPGNGRSQYLPRLAAGAGQRVDAVFYDRRLDVRNRLNDVAYTVSHDGGRTFAPNRRLNSRSFNSEIGQRYGVVSAEGKVEFGARLGLLGGRDSTVAVWTDTSNGTVQTTGQDVFAATVVFPSGPRLDRRLPVAAAALVLVGLALATRRPRPAGPRGGSC